MNLLKIVHYDLKSLLKGLKIMEFIIFICVICMIILNDLTANNILIIIFALTILNYFIIGKEIISDFKNDIILQYRINNNGFITILMAKIIYCVVANMPILAFWLFLKQF
ncbi:MAG: hypothetical protein ISQ32_05040 [Rickettsiales bacterium]|nr:hypothetical protein [Rickettsiales bacterium]